MLGSNTNHTCTLLGLPFYIYLSGPSAKWPSFMWFLGKHHRWCWSRHIEAFLITQETSQKWTNWAKSRKVADGICYPICRKCDPKRTVQSRTSSQGAGASVVISDWEPSGKRTVAWTEGNWRRFQCVVSVLQRSLDLAELLAHGSSPGEWIFSDSETNQKSEENWKHKETSSAFGIILFFNLTYKNI